MIGIMAGIMATRKLAQCDRGNRFTTERVPPPTCYGMKRLPPKVAEQDRICAICHEEFTDYTDVVPDHRDPKGMGAWRDDHPDNIQATHWWCNGEKAQPESPNDGRLVSKPNIENRQNRSAAMPVPAEMTAPGTPAYFRS